ncbi:TetR/AcrR family transcriptional regulator [Cupriavidus metallidurans]|jgi:TetR/AcrR family transcriptional regulator|uniref:Transcriptional regulator, TetR family n=2 Tax=Cupriavidus metallidurans TaxID=119219 RepID=Q1LS48_CUPMC|nr:MULTISPECIES: nucleoid occlusion factor SlmA [Cupriavidus]ABF07028.1 transcriptional regulator, TetR family [Cupriavidus metallidurans CH34]AVA32252.1 nucleoid occlusion factor SlmA [Cupriavidus metallidurans]KWR80474.1 dihydroorotate oxidase [Cupriavidus sp. SHE]KWW34006.1 Nucleoid occlusion factor SlmA [Cupriavidus metallidurans]MDE4916451.1 nucleoid occlusion factor SlmA [Cupriavidus metallidurans]
MTQTISSQAEADTPAGHSPEAAPARKRPRPGERRIQILQTLAGMLEHPRGEKITTAALAAKLSVSEAALYRHFASKAQMFEGLIGFIEQTVFGLINQITTQEEHGLRQAQAIVRMLLSFAEKNPGMTRVLTGEALVGEHERLQERINQMIDRIEASLRQCLKVAVSQAAFPPDADIPLRVALITAAVQGHWHRFVKSGFRKAPTENIDAQLRILLG